MQFVLLHVTGLDPSLIVAEKVEGITLLSISLDMFIEKIFMRIKTVERKVALKADQRA